MDRPRRVRSPPFGYDTRILPRPDPRAPPDYDDPYSPMSQFEPNQPGPGFVEPSAGGQYPVGYRESRLPSTYRATLREPPPAQIVTGSAPYKILCITNINQKVSDIPVKEALVNDFSRFGHVSVSICHDSGERLAYIYFRTYEEAREARHAKSRTILFDRPIEIEPIYEPRSSPVRSPPPPTQAPPQPMYSRRRSMTPPDYYDIQARRLPPPPHGPPDMPHGRAMTPPNYPIASRYPPEMAGPPVPYGHYYPPPPHSMGPPSPYSSPPHEQFRSYHPHVSSAPMSQYPPLGHPYPPYGGPMSVRDRERSMNEAHLSRSPRHEHYYPIDNRGYPMPPPSKHGSRGPQHLSSSYMTNLPAMHHQSGSSMGRRLSPPPPPNHMEYPRYTSREFKREKMNHDNNNIEPEEGRPSRVLFVTNIDPSQTEADLRNIFDSFGMIEDLEIRKITPEMSSALIRFSSMDCAYKAKTATNGKYLGSLKCRLTYGKASASQRLWIGGFSPATTISRLEDEFERFGEIVHLDYISGRPYAYIEYETPNQAQFAALHLRGSLVADADRRLRIEFVDPVSTREVSKLDSSVHVSDISSRSRTTNESWSTNDNDPSPLIGGSRKRSISPTEVSAKRLPQSHLYNRELSKFDRRSDTSKPRSPSTDSPINLPSSGDTRDEVDNNNSSMKNGSNEHENLIDQLSRSKSIREMVECCPINWFGQLVLRNFNFPSQMFLCSGRKSTIENYITKLDGDTGNECPILRITQRWRLHPQPKLEEVKRRMQSGNLGMLIITSKLDASPLLSSPTCATPQSSTSQAGKQNGANEQSLDDDHNQSGKSTGQQAVTQSRPLKNLISYLEQKDAAGVISLNQLDDQVDIAGGPKLLYAFPPGDFALELLQQIAPMLSRDASKEEFLLGVIVGASETKV